MALGSFSQAFSDLRIATKQRLAAGLILLVILVMGGFALNRMQDIRDQTELVYANWLPRVVAISDLNLAVSDLRRRQLQYAFAPSLSQRQVEQTAMGTQLDEIADHRDAYDSLRVSTSMASRQSAAQENALYDSFDRTWEDYVDISILFLEQVDRGDDALAQDLMREDGDALYRQMSADLAGLVRVNQWGAANAAETSDDIFRTTRTFIILSLILAVLIAATVGTLIVRSLTRPVYRLERAARQVTGGDLDVQIQEDGDDELSSLSRSFNRMTHALREARSREAAQTEALQRNNNDLEQAMARLKAMQQQLVTREKMASLGQLTAGIAHEIKNPLNFVNNFAELSVELTTELEEELDENAAKPISEVRDDLADILNDLRFNAQKIHEHGTRADRIVRAMLEHSRTGVSQREPGDVNGLVEEFVNLAFHGMRAADQSFQVTLDRDYAGDLPRVPLIAQDMGRVFINLLNNAFYAVNKRAKTAREAGETGYEPHVAIRTRLTERGVEVEVEDNGSGIPETVQARIFEPFFTTKPTGSGTGLGLSISYDIVTEGHEGVLELDSAEGRGTSFTVALPTEEMLRDQKARDAALDAALPSGTNIPSGMPGGPVPPEATAAATGNGMPPTPVTPHDS